MSTTSNIPEISIGKLVEKLAKLYVAAINGYGNLRKVPTPFLWGPPGVGKSEGIEEMAEMIEKATGLEVIITDIRLLLFSPVDLRGVPVPDEEKRFSNWLMPKIFDLNPSENVLNIVFWDELSAAPPAVQAAAYQMILNKCIGEHKFPENVIMVAAGNRLSDNSVAHRMPNALSNRLMHFEIQVDFESWKEWATANHVHPYVIDYLTFDQRKLYQEKVETEEKAFATPRSWVFVSDLLNAMGNDCDLDEMFDFIGGCIGVGNAMEFIHWVKNNADVPKLEDIFAGNAKCPRTADALYAVIGSISEHVKKHPRLTNTALENMVRYCMQFPKDYQACVFTELCMEDDVKMKLLKIPMFRNWMKMNQW